MAKQKSAQDKQLSPLSLSLSLSVSLSLSLFMCVPPEKKNTEEGTSGQLSRKTSGTVWEPLSFGVNGICLSWGHSNLNFAVCYCHGKGRRGSAAARNKNDLIGFA
jgi:hypothetical protein